jgi:hypothetical protein
MAKLSFMLVSIWRIVAVEVAVGTVIMPFVSASAAPDGAAPASETFIPSGAMISYNGDEDALIGRTLFNRGIAGSISGDIQHGLPMISLEPAGSDHGSPDDSLTDLVGIVWHSDW